jgi:uncharacterized protein (TIGR02246 family)
MAETEQRTEARPEDVVRDFADRLNRGDVESALELYEPDAAFVPEPGRTVRGADAIREELEALVALKPELTGETQGVRVGGDVALVLHHWSMRGESPDGPVEMGGTSADVLRRQEDGSWRVLIDDPWGAAGTG